MIHPPVPLLIPRLVYFFRAKLGLKSPIPAVCLGVLLLLNCLGVHNDIGKIASLQFAAANLNKSAAQFSSNPGSYSGSPSAEKAPDYTFSEKEISIAADFRTSILEMGAGHEEAIQKTVSNLSETYYFVQKSDDEIEADVLDWDLGLPPENRTLTEDKKAEIRKKRMDEANTFYSGAEAEISGLNDDTLLNLRINAALGIISYDILKSEFDKNPDLDRDFIRKNLEWQVKLREKAIDEIKKRGIEK